uniref:Xylanolytic transcriptional activator regulatory domain-containing protein n=1 Tax=Bionectria ochroleuca TaxID=29856 RepID=A0A8H7NQJ3_BIOOC
MLDPIALAARCEDEIWNVDAPLETNKGLRNFLALYYIVVAIGALGATAGISQHFERDIKMCMKECPNSSLPVSSQSLSTKYFRKSRALLGDVFEVCSLESAQTLHLMSIYCQNALKPHACYLYCGHAVRTALAIGITRESMSNSIEDRKAARRTWWCIYSHEIEMSCNAGRRDSLGKPRNYQIDLPRIRAQSSSVPDGSELENCSVAMINEMAHFAAVLRRISKKLYYDSKGLTLLQKSVVAQELDTLLDDWKGQLPTYLDFGSVSFRQEEWAAKQKLVLHLRYLHAKIVLHRPFLEAPMSGTTTRMSRHVDSCLEAARDTIRVIYDAYTNRHYFRTWWYNSTYTLYAGMIVLYVVILGQAAVSSNELLDDVVKAQDILQSMEEAIVARRSANLIREGLEVAQACIQNQQNQSARHEGTESEQEHDASPGQSDLNNMASQAGSEFSRTLFSHAVPGQDPALLASIVDPNLLRDFTAAEDMSGLEFPMFPFEGYGLDADPT